MNFTALRLAFAVLGALVSGPFSAGEDQDWVIGPALEAPRTTADPVAAWYAQVLDSETLAKLGPDLSKAEALVEAYLVEPQEALRLEILNDLLALKLPAAALRAILREGPAQAEVPRTGSFEAKAAVPGFDGRAVKLSVRVPEGYTPSQRWPLILALHGTLGTGQYLEHWNGSRGAEKYLIVAPWADCGHGWGPSRFGRAQVLGTLAWVRTHYRIDPERVYVEGFSMGGTGSKKLAALFVDRFAALCSRSGPPLRSNQEALYRNLAATGVMNLGGEMDSIVPAEALRKEDDAMRAAGIETVFKMHSGRKHDIFQDLNGEVLEFFSEHVRNAYPETLKFASYENGWGAGGWWIEISEPESRANFTYPEHVLDIAKVKAEQAKGVDIFLPKNMEKLIASHPEVLLDTLTLWSQPRTFAAHLDRKANAVVIDEAQRIVRLKIYLADEMLDLDREISVVYRGRTLVRKKLERDVSILLEEARRRERRDLSYWGFLEVRLSP